MFYSGEGGRQNDRIRRFSNPHQSCPLSGVGLFESHPRTKATTKSLAPTDNCVAYAKMRKSVSCPL